MLKIQQRWISRSAMALIGILAIHDASAQSTASSGVGMRVLSSRPDMVSGGDALVEVRLPAGVAAATITADGRDVTGAFKPGTNPSTLVGLVEGLKLGKNMLRAAAGSTSAQLEITNYPLTGPIVSGPHLTPFVCTTADVGLGAPLDA